MSALDYKAERDKYKRGNEIALEAAVDACSIALKSIGVAVTDAVTDSLYEALRWVI